MGNGWRRHVCKINLLSFRKHWLRSLDVYELVSRIASFKLLRRNLVALKCTVFDYDRRGWLFHILSVFIKLIWFVKLHVMVYHNIAIDAIWCLELCVVLSLRLHLFLVLFFV